MRSPCPRPLPSPSLLDTPGVPNPVFVLLYPSPLPSSSPTPPSLPKYIKKEGAPIIASSTAARRRAGPPSGVHYTRTLAFAIRQPARPLPVATPRPTCLPGPCMLLLLPTPLAPTPTIYIQRATNSASCSLNVPSLQSAQSSLSLCRLPRNARTSASCSRASPR